MTVKYHFSINGPNRELLGVQAEGVGDQIYSEFIAAIQDVGLDGAYGQVAGGVTGAAIATATAITAPAPNAYATPPAYAAPAAVPGAPACHHGAMTRRTGTNNRGPWVGYFCPSPKGTPDQCSPKFQ